MAELINICLGDCRSNLAFSTAVPVKGMERERENMYVSRHVCVSAQTVFHDMFVYRGPKMKKVCFYRYV